MSNFKAKMHQIQFWLGSAPDPAGGAYSAPQTPLLDLGAFFQGDGKGKEGVEGGERPPLLFTADLHPWTRSSTLQPPVTATHAKLQEMSRSKG